MRTIGLFVCPQRALRAALFLVMLVRDQPGDRHLEAGGVMPLQPLEYHRPTDMAQARELLQRNDLRAAPLLPGPRAPEARFADIDVAVDVGQLGLKYIRVSDPVLRIGAATPLQMVAESTAVQAEARGLLAEAARLVAPLTLRNFATLGGAWQAVDGPPEVRLALLVMNATRAPDDPLAEIIVPRSPQPGLGAAFARVARSPRDEAIVAAAAKLYWHEGVCRNVRLALAGAHPQPIRITSAEAVLEGQPWSEARLRAVAERVMAEARPISDYRGSAEYRREMAGVLAKRALQTAWQRAATTNH
jgi:CO/xanthine dehydrogenase FAD-binding subunit